MDNRIHRPLARLAVAALALLAGACGLDKQTPGSFFGPSEFGLSLTMAATPDQLHRDGVSQSVVRLTAVNDKGQPAAGQTVRLSLVSGPGDVVLSATQVVTDSSGQATFTVRAPAQASPGSSTITIAATPVGDNSANAVARVVSISLIGQANTTLPTASFTFTPASPAVGTAVTFDASASTDEGAVCASACTYTWNFGDGATGSGVVATHTYSTPQNFDVVLTVRDAAGASGTQVRVVAVTASATTVDFNVSGATGSLTKHFDGSATVPPSGVTITSYTWLWNDGSSNTGPSSSPQASHTFAAAGTYNVTLTVVDSAGRTTSRTKSVAVP